MTRPKLVAAYRQWREDWKAQMQADASATRAGGEGGHGVEMTGGEGGGGAEGSGGDEGSTAGPSRVSPCAHSLYYCACALLALWLVDGALCNMAPMWFVRDVVSPAR